jgi:hypothetical protein
VFSKAVEKKPVWNKCYESDIVRKNRSNESIPRFVLVGCAAMIDKDVMVLQKYTNSAMEVREPCGEPNPTSPEANQVIYIKVEEVSDAEEDPNSGDASQAIKIKVEEVSDAEEDPNSGDASQAIKIKVVVSDAEEEVGPVPISFPKIKTEPEVSCMSPYVHCKK